MSERVPEDPDIGPFDAGLLGLLEYLHRWDAIYTEAERAFRRLPPAVQEVAIGKGPGSLDPDAVGFLVMTYPGDRQEVHTRIAGNITVIEERLRGDRSPIGESELALLRGAAAVILAASQRSRRAMLHFIEVWRAGDEGTLVVRSKARKRIEATFMGNGRSAP